MGIEVRVKKGGPMAGMNVVPLIDILLVLIIIFMVITPLTPMGLEAVVPQPSNQAEPGIDYRIVVVQVLDRDRLRINDEPATWDNLGQRLADIFKLRAERVAFVKGEDSVLFEDVARAIDVMRSSNVDKVGLLSASLETH
jgi:biopolymer transport protein ExbD